MTIQYTSNIPLRVPTRGTLEWDIPLNQNAIYSDMLFTSILSGNYIVSGMVFSHVENFVVTFTSGIIAIDGEMVAVEGENISCNASDDTVIYYDILGGIVTSTSSQISDRFFILAIVESDEFGVIKLSDVGNRSGSTWSGNNELTLSTIVTYKGTTLSVSAGENLTAGMPVSQASDGLWYKADASNANRVPAIGLCTATISGGYMGEIIVNGLISNEGWNWTLSNMGLIYLSTTSGQMTQSAPEANDTYVQIIGKAYSQTEMFVNPSLVLIENGVI